MDPNTVLPPVVQDPVQYNIVYIVAEYTKYLHMQDPGRRLLRMGRLAEEILLDNNSRILEERLNFVRHNPSFRKRIASMQSIRNPCNAAQRVGTVLLPASTPGSPGVLAGKSTVPTR